MSLPRRLMLLPICVAVTLSGCAQGEDAPGHDGAGTTVSASPAAAPTITAPETASPTTAPETTSAESTTPPPVQTFSPVISIGKASDAAKINIDDADFKAFLGREVTRLGKTGCDLAGQVEGPGIAVERYRADGWAMGNEVCGSGWVSVWSKRGGWHEAVSMQEPPMCSVVDKEKIPAAFVAECFTDESGAKLRKNTNR